MANLTNPNDPIYTQNPGWLRPGETSAQWKVRTGGATATPAPASSYTGPSIVDYLKGAGQSSDYSSRAGLAQQYGIQGYQGTAAQNTQLLSSLRGASTLTPTGGSSAEIDPANGPALDANTGNIVAAGTGASASWDATMADFQERIKSLSDLKSSTDSGSGKELTAIQKLIGKKEDLRATQKSAVELRQEALTQAYSEMGVTPEQIQKIGGLIGEITSFNQQLADIEVRKQAALDRTEGEMASSDFISKEQNRINKAFNGEISAKGIQAAVKVQELQMLQGAYTDAKNTASQIVSLATYDQQQAVADIEWSIGAHQDLYNLMSGEEQQTWNRQYQLAKDQLATAKANTTYVSNIMIDPTLSGAGVLITDTVAEANAKVSAYVGSQPYLNRVAQIGAAGRAPKDDPDGIKPISGFASSDVEVSVRGFINDFITNKGKLGVITDTQKQELLNSIKIEYSPNEITDFDAVKRILGMIESRPFSEFLGTELFSRPNVQSPQQSFPTSVQPTTQQTGSLQDWLDNPGAGMSLLAPIFN